MNHFAYAFLALAALGCTPAVALAPAGAGLPAGPAAGAPTAGAPVKGTPGTVTLQQGGAPIAIGTAWEVSTHATISFRNEASRSGGADALKVVFDHDALKTKMTPALYVAPGWKTEEITSWVLSGDIGGKTFFSGSHAAGNQLVMADTTARIKGQLQLRMRPSMDVQGSDSDYVLDFDFPYPVTP